MKRFACQDIIPGCSHVFTGADDQSVLDQVIVHAAEDHGLVKPPLALVELVVATTYSFTPARPRGHLRLVGAEPADDGLDNEPCAADRPMQAPTSQLRRSRPACRSGSRPPSRSCGAESPRSDARCRARTAQAGAIVDPTVTGRTEKYRHECLFYRGADGFLAAVVPFIRDGLALGSRSWWPLPSLG